MASSPSSKISFFTIGGRFIQSPIEGLECGISVDIPKGSEGTATLRLGSTDLPLWFGDDLLCALSAWPANATGQYTLYLKCGDVSERRIVTVRPQYFNEREFDQILLELRETLPLAIATRLQECGALQGMMLTTSSSGDLSLEQEYDRLRRAVRGTKARPGILQLLPMIQRDCHQTLIPKHEIRRANKTRRPDMAKLPVAMSMPGNVGANGTLKEMYDLTVERSYETYENRLVKSYAQALQSQMLKLISRLETEPAPPNIALEVQEMYNEFRMTCVRTAFLNQVRLPFISVGRITMVLLKKTAYRTVLEDYLAMYKRIPVTLRDPAINAPLNKFAYLYQLWANMKVVKAMVQVCADAGYRCVDQPWVQRDNSGIFFDLMKDCAVAMELISPTSGKTVKLIPWSPASGQVPTNHRLDLPPAVAICVYNVGAPPVVLVFDPKYKVVGDDSEEALAKRATSQNEVNEAIRKIEPMPEHLDELRTCIDEVKSPTGQKEIRYAAVLYPGMSKQLSLGLEAVSARPNDGDAMEKHISEVLKLHLV